jgi:hypothetical protein
MGIAFVPFAWVVHGIIFFAEHLAAKVHKNLVNVG